MEQVLIQLIFSHQQYHKGLSKGHDFSRIRLCSPISTGLVHRRLQLPWACWRVRRCISIQGHPSKSGQGGPSQGTQKLPNSEKSFFWINPLFDDERWFFHILLLLNFPLKQAEVPSGYSEDMPSESSGWVNRIRQFSENSFFGSQAVTFQDCWILGKWRKPESARGRIEHSLEGAPSLPEKWAASGALHCPFTPDFGAQGSGRDSLSRAPYIENCWQRRLSQTAQELPLSSLQNSPYQQRILLSLSEKSLGSEECHSGSLTISLPACGLLVPGSLLQVGNSDTVPAQVWSGHWWQGLQRGTLDCVCEGKKRLGSPGMVWWWAGTTEVVWGTGNLCS